MDWLIVVLVILVLGNLGLLFALWRRSGGGSSDSMLLLQNQLQDLTRSMEQKLGEGTDRMFKGMQTQSDQAHRLMRDRKSTRLNSSH